MKYPSRGNRAALPLMSVRLMSNMLCSIHLCCLLQQGLSAALCADKTAATPLWVSTNIQHVSHWLVTGDYDDGDAVHYEHHDAMLQSSLCVVATNDCLLLL